MSYVPPGSTSVHFDFTEVQLGILYFDFTDLYSPPAWNALHFNFTTVLFPLDFEFAPELPEPISKEMLLSLAVRLHGQVYKYWICYVVKGKQYIRRYGNEGLKDPWWLSEYQTKFAQAVLYAQGLNESERAYWESVGVKKLEPLPWWNAVISAFMNDKIN